MDHTLLTAVLTLLGFGVIMVFSASSVEASVVNNNPYYYLERQLIWAGMGLFLMLALARIDYHVLLRFAEPIAWATFALLVLVLVPHVGKDINGARRWLGFGSLLFQPSEMAKFSLVLLFAKRLATEKKIRSFYHGILLPLLILSVMAGLIIKEPDLGTALALTGTVMAMLFIAGVNGLQLGAVIAAFIPAVGVLIAIAPYRMQRFLAFLDPKKDPLGSGYHIIQSLYALGSGGLFGVGLGQGALKYFYLPEQHTDFIFAIVGEELGLIGAAVLIALFFVLTLRGLRVAMLAPDRFGALLATGLTAMVAVQALLNIAVVTASMPITGVPLPFISYGGSSLLFALAGIGVLLNVSRHRVSA
ncbi:MAG: putative lipid II flippase FtsW [Thermaerobacter sp.]|nr:putative lipid II flippase FtsW [Thermaerobacter sp.]